MSISVFVRTFPTEMRRSPFTLRLSLLLPSLSLTGDDRNIVEVFVAGRKVVPFAEPNQSVL